jgi:hypothetical protein
MVFECEPARKPSKLPSVVLSVLLVALFARCGDQPKSKSSDPYLQVDSMVVELANKDSADARWYQPIIRKEYEQLITSLELDSALTYPPNKRIVLVGTLIDVYRRDSQYVACFSGGVNYERTIYYYLNCSQSQTATLLSHHSRLYSDKFIVVAIIRRVDDVAFKISSEIIDQGSASTIVDVSSDNIAVGELISYRFMKDFGYIEWPTSQTDQ